MSTSKEVEGEAVLHPEILSVALLDEIAGRLLKLEEIQRGRESQGFVTPMEPITVTDQLTELNAPKDYNWFSITIINDGPDDCWALVNPRKNPTPHHVLNGETYNVDMRRGIIRTVHLWCDPGASTNVRMVGVR